MISIITKTGAFLYKFTEQQADEKMKQHTANEDGFINKLRTEQIGWIYCTNELPDLLEKLEISICYIENSNTFIKCSLQEFRVAWINMKRNE